MTDYLQLGIAFSSRDFSRKLTCKYCNCIFLIGYLSFNVRNCCFGNGNLLFNLYFVNFRDISFFKSLTYDLVVLFSCFKSMFGYFQLIIKISHLKVGYCNIGNNIRQDYFTSFFCSEKFIFNSIVFMTKFSPEIKFPRHASTGCRWSNIFLVAIYCSSILKRRKQICFGIA
ncbi:hypothetical protein D3C80_1388860 [compost metagenome]